MSIAGIDVSHANGTIDWDQAVGGLDFAVCKATEALTFRDPQFARNWAEIARTGLLRSAYHFARPGSGSAQAQAAHFLATVGPLAATDLPLCLDLEATTLDRAGTTQWALDWLTTVDQATGRRTILYTGPGFIASHLDAGRLTGWPLWVAEYPAHDDQRKGPPIAPWGSWLWWQHTSSARITGIGGDVDLDRCDLTRSQLAALSGTPMPAPPAPTPKEDPDMAPLAVRDDSDGSVWVTTADPAPTRWHVPDADALGSLLFLGAVRVNGAGNVPATVPHHLLARIPIVNATLAA